jgi:hypothetical protein
MTIYSEMYGVVDHNKFEFYGQTNGVRDYPEAYGDTAFSQPTQFGTANFVFIEDNVFNGGFVNDCNNGGREVARYNYYSANPNDPVADSGAIQTHEISQGVSRYRGCRALERYHNYAYNPTPSSPEYGAGDAGSGTGLHWANTISTGYNYDIVTQYIGRELAANNCGAGANHAGGCPASPSSFGYCGTGSTGVTSSWDGNSNPTTGYPCMGETGRGQGDLVNNANFPSAANSVSGTQSWPHEKREPWYIWNETMAGGSALIANPAWNGVQMKPDRNFYAQVANTPNSSPTSPFNGTTGTGFGTLANRPTTCTAGPGGTYDTSPTGSYGVGYFATDQNTLYVCTSTNTWTAIYQPYAYPHPLTAGGTTLSGNTPTAPTGLVAIVQ